MKLKSNKVLFIPKDKDTEVCIPRPQSSKKYIPEWFKKMPSLVKTINGLSQDGTAKMCMPFLDSLVSGYTQELPCDVYIQEKRIRDLQIQCHISLDTIKQSFIGIPFGNQKHLLDIVLFIFIQQIGLTCPL